MYNVLEDRSITLMTLSYVKKIDVNPPDSDHYAYQWWWYVIPKKGTPGQFTWRINFIIL